ncbi:MAG TPA: MFS transporter [Moraxellaceae bacterium]|nr:MFS transporter [Moraxellaceae bacterium]
MTPESPLRSRLWLLVSLYICQGLPTGVFTQALPALLRRYDVPLTVIGLSGMLAAPWALKFLWAPLVERHFSRRVGQRRSWILPMQLAALLALLAIAAFDPHRLANTAGIAQFFVLMFLVNLVAATQDIATDGLAVRLLAFHERGLGNGVQVAGFRLGLIIGGGLLLFLIGTWEWRTAFLLLAVLLVLLSLPVLLYREPPPLHARQAQTVPYVQIFTSFFSRPGLRGWLLVLATYKIGESLGAAMVKPMLVDMGLDLRQIGLLVSVVGSLAALSGALLGGALTTHLGRRTALLGFGALQAVSVTLYALLPLWHQQTGVLPLPGVVALNALEHFASGMAMAAMLTAVMDLARAEHAAADFTVQVSCLSIFGGGASLLAGALADALGFTGYFLVSGGLALVLLWPAAVYCRHLPWLLPDGLPVAGDSGENARP